MGPSINQWQTTYRPDNIITRGRPTDEYREKKYGLTVHMVIGWYYGYTRTVEAFYIYHGWTSGMGGWVVCLLMGMGGLFIDGCRNGKVV